jgi:hypothetical protein
VTDKNPGGHIDFFTYQSDLAHSDWSAYFKIWGENTKLIDVFGFWKVPNLIHRILCH